MKWVEVIRLCTTAERRVQVLENMSQTITKIESKAPLASVSVLRHAYIETDLILLLRFESNTIQPGSCSIATQLSSALKEHGLVDHSVWIEIHESALPG